MRSYRLSRHKIASFCFLTSLSLLAVSCRENDSTAPRPTARLSPPQGPSQMISIDDSCWWDISYNCGDWHTHSGGLGGFVNSNNYGWLGGTAACYTSELGSCGGGFGNWNDGSGCIVSHATPECRSVVGAISASWIGCPTQIQFNSLNVTNGATESWILTRTGTYYMYGWRMGAYTGSYSANGMSTNNVIGHMVCAAGFIAGNAQG